MAGLPAFINRRLACKPDLEFWYRFFNNANGTADRSHLGMHPLSLVSNKDRMFEVSHLTLIIIAACVWYAGSLALLVKGSRLLLTADGLHPDLYWTWLSPVAGLLIGGLKARYLFQASCQKNLDRIRNLAHPKVWQFFRPGFMIFLVLMIMGGAALSRLAQHSYPFLITVATIDFSLAAALLLSGRLFWQNKRD